MLPAASNDWVTRKSYRLLKKVMACTESDYGQITAVLQRLRRARPLLAALIGTGN